MQPSTINVLKPIGSMVQQHELLQRKHEKIEEAGFTTNPLNDSRRRCLLLLLRSLLLLLDFLPDLDDRLLLLRLDLAERRLRRLDLLEWCRLPPDSSSHSLKNSSLTLRAASQYPAEPTRQLLFYDYRSRSWNSYMALRTLL